MIDKLLRDGLTGTDMKGISLPIAADASDARGLWVSGDGVFLTRQGEGATMGQPAVFLRTNECNLDCSFCDTPYTWKREDPGYAERQHWSLEHARTEILGATRDGCTRMVFTGGEPLLQQRALAKLAGMPGLEDWDVEIETNATIVPEAFRGRGKVQINCSPKLANSGIALERRLRPAVLRALAADFRAYFKFVVERPEDLDEIEREYGPYLAGVDPHRVYMTPEGVTPERLDHVRDLVRPSVEKRGWVLGDRRHIRVNNGDVRGT